MRCGLFLYVWQVLLQCGLPECVSLVCIKMLTAQIYETRLYEALTTHIWHTCIKVLAGCCGLWMIDRLVLSCCHHMFDRLVLRAWLFTYVSQAFMDVLTVHTCILTGCTTRSTTGSIRCGKSQAGASAEDCPGRGRGRSCQNDILCNANAFLIFFTKMVGSCFVFLQLSVLCKQKVSEV